MFNTFPTNTYLCVSREPRSRNGAGANRFSCHIGPHIPRSLSSVSFLVLKIQATTWGKYGTSKRTKRLIFKHFIGIGI